MKCLQMFAVYFVLIRFSCTVLYILFVLFLPTNRDYSLSKRKHNITQKNQLKFLSLFVFSSSQSFLDLFFFHFKTRFFRWDFDKFIIKTRNCSVLTFFSRISPWFVNLIVQLFASIYFKWVLTVQISDLTATHTIFFSKYNFVNCVTQSTVTLKQLCLCFCYLLWMLSNTNIYHFDVSFFGWFFFVLGSHQFWSTQYSNGHTLL